MHFVYSLLAILNEMSPYLLLGFFIAGLLHVFVKPSLMGKHLAGNGIKPVLKSALLGIPLPLCSCGVLPTAVSLKRNGASNAAATSFLIATPQTGLTPLLPLTPSWVMRKSPWQGCILIASLQSQRDVRAVTPHGARSAECGVGDTACENLR